MAESDMKEQIVAVLAEIREQSTKIDGLANKMEAVEGKVGSMEEIKPVIIDLALWKPKVDQAVGALQADLGNLRVHLDRLVQHASTTPAPPPLPSPVDRRPDLRVQVGDDGRHGPGGHRVDINSRGSVMGAPPHMTPAKDTYGSTSAPESTLSTPREREGNRGKTPRMDCPGFDGEGALE
uniref:Uncharacterized protein n=1 Tax=Avena sativa TaxID=4498 RepID=A0ACD5XSC5_AVESA